MQELKAKPWKFEESFHPDGVNSFFDELKSYLILSRDIEGYIRTMKNVNEMFPFYGDYSDWIESILMENVRTKINSTPCPENWASESNPVCKKDPTTNTIRSLNYEMIRELSMLNTLLQFVNNSSGVLVQEDSQKYQYLISKLNPFKNANGLLDMSIWRQLADPTSTADISDVINGYQRLLADARGYTNSAIRLLERVSVYATRCTKTNINDLVDMVEDSKRIRLEAERDLVEMESDSREAQLEIVRLQRERELLEKAERAQYMALQEAMQNEASEKADRAEYMAMQEAIKKDAEILELKTRHLMASGIAADKSTDTMPSSDLGMSEVVPTAPPEADV